MPPNKYQKYVGPRLRRVCHKCGDMYTPLGKYCRLCDNCNPQANSLAWLTDKIAQQRKETKKHKLKGYLDKIDKNGK